MPKLKKEVQTGANRMRAVRIKLYRQLCGLSGKEAAGLLKIRLGDYYKKEHFELPIKEFEVKLLQTKYYEWREKEISYLKNRIDYLKLIK